MPMLFDLKNIKQLYNNEELNIKIKENLKSFNLVVFPYNIVHIMYFSPYINTISKTKK